MTWPARWRARWIWLDGATQWAFFRRTFDVTSDVRARCRVTADARYAMWCNGTRIGAGPVRSEPSLLSYDEYELELHAGANTIAVLARWYGRPTLYWKPATSWHMLGRGGILFEMDEPHIGSDAGWCAAIPPYEDTTDGAEEGAPDTEILTPSAMEGWIEEDFDDNRWRRATELDGWPLGTPVADPPVEPFGSLAPRPIPHLTETMLSPAHAFARNGATIFDMGRIVNGHPIVRARGDVEVRAGEDLVDDGVTMDVRSWTMASRGSGTMESFEPIGFRYLEVRGDVADVAARERLFPRAQGASFDSGDAELDAIWEAGARTLDLCSTDASIDCPGREQRAWLGDAYLHALLAFVTNPDTSLARWTARLHASAPRPDGLLPMTAANDFSLRPITIPDFTLHWVRSLARIHEYTGDLNLIAALLPIALRGLDHFERLRDDAGLIANLNGWIFIDWAQTERGENIAAIDALYALACDDAAACARALGDEGTGARLSSRAERTRKAFHRYFDPTRGVYVDALGGGARGRRASQQTNSLAIVSGAASPAEFEGILDVILDPARLVRTRTPADPGTLDERVRSQVMPLRDFDEGSDVVEAQPFFAHFLHQALAQANRYDEIVASIRRWRAMLARGNGCFEEYWDAAPGMGSRAHAWSATPTYDLTTHVLGARPGAPGWSHVIVEPHVASGARARGCVPTPRGWLRIDASTAAVHVDLPAGSTGELRMNGAVRPL